MFIQRIGSQPSAKQPAENFTGSVRRDQMFAADAPAVIVTSTVTFEPGARTAWHIHPLGQLIIITAGIGWVQAWGQLKQEVRQGDVAWFAPGEKGTVNGLGDQAAIARLDTGSASALKI
jgi:quercetin dioxygenase-like cupin family protein